jgi:hypothetical protein
VSRSWFWPRLFGSCNDNTTNWPTLLLTYLLTHKSISQWRQQLILYSFNVWRGTKVAYLVEALCYKPESSRFDSQRDHWIFQLT